MALELQMNPDELLPLRDVVLQTLRRAILTGELKPGERLMEIHLADKLGVSRTPVREAIHKLEQEGLVTVIPRRGAEVAQITEKSMNDVLEVRRFLDALCVELACDRITSEGVEQLCSAQEEFEEAVKSKDLREMARKDVKFHEIIVEATGNLRMVSIINNLSEQMYRFRFEYLKDVSRHERLVEEHRLILDSIREKNKALAADTAKLHIDNQMESIMERIRMEK